jgi:hypothetical protein
MAKTVKEIEGYYLCVHGNIFGMEEKLEEYKNSENVFKKSLKESCEKVRAEEKAAKMKAKKTKPKKVEIDKEDL